MNATTNLAKNRRSILREHTRRYQGGTIFTTIVNEDSNELFITMKLESLQGLRTMLIAAQYTELEHEYQQFSDKRYDYKKEHTPWGRLDDMILETFDPNDKPAMKIEELEKTLSDFQAIAKRIEALKRSI